MNIIIPLGGRGSRFKDEGYSKPKPLIQILGKEMIFYLIDNLNIGPNDNLFIIYHSDLDNYNFTSLIRNRYSSNIYLIRLDRNTFGACDTVLYGVNHIDECYYNYKTILCDCDTFYYYDIIEHFRKQSNNAIFCFRDLQNKPIYSYINFDDNNIIYDIKEKNKISNYANTGCYCFENLFLLKKYCEKVINNKDNYETELFTSYVISEMIKDKHIFYANEINIRDFKCVGTPLQLKLFCDNNIENSPKLRICFDLDNTLVSYPVIKGDYATVKPIQNNIDYLKYLKNIGHTIIIYTARRMRTHNGNIGKVTKDISKITLEILEKFDIPYDELYFGKPYAHFYIDDLGINAFSDLEKEIGIYKTRISERSFNSIYSDKLDIIVKKSDDNKLLGEIYYYQNIPLELKKHFPIFINSGTNWYSIEKINGITLSYLYVNESLSPEIFYKYLELLNKIHCYDTNIKTNIYSNYYDKLVDRYSNYDYNKYHNSDIVYNKLLDYFKDYELNNKGKNGIIHGDPVLSNCILEINNELKLIDMRGYQGNELSIYGDIYYDYGKIYQSITGYDEILLNKNISNNYKNKILQVFENFIKNKYDYDKIKMIRNMLLFTLIPLHDDPNKCQKYYDLIDI